MIRARRGLIVEVTERRRALGRRQPAHADGEAGAQRAARSSMAAELHRHGVAAIAIVPGFLRSESMLEHFGVTEATWRDGGKKDRTFSRPNRRCSSGVPWPRWRLIPPCSSATVSCVSSWELARVYGFTDANGSRPDWGAHVIDWSAFPAAFIQMFRDGAAQRERVVEDALRPRRGVSATDP